MSTCPRCHRSFAEGVRFCPDDGTLVANVVDVHLGTTLMGQFRLVELAGRGAMGTVYRATQLRVDRTVAVKVLRGDLLKDQTAVQRFLREAQAAARLSHPHIVTVYMVGETPASVPFIVMEYVAGPTLGEVCEREGTLETRRALGIARQIASALVEAHAHGIVHRDLKAENILLAERPRLRASTPPSPSTTDDFVKVLDFGIAKLLGGGGELAQLTRDGTIFGTPHYIAPEQASGEAVDGRADLYSLGVILFRMLTGRLPFDGDSGMQVLMRHLREPPPRPRTLRPELPEPVEALILHALEKDRARRFADAEHFIAAIDSVGDAVADAATTWSGVPRPGLSPTPSTPVSLPARGLGARPAPRGAAALSDPSTTQTGELGLDAWADQPPADADDADCGADDEGEDEDDALPRRATRRSAQLYAAGESHAGRSMDAEDSAGIGVASSDEHDLNAEFDEPVLPRGRARQVVMVAALALLGLGGAAALWQWARGGQATPAIPATVLEALPAPAGTTTLVQEHVVATGALALRAGFESAPTVGAVTVLRVVLRDAHGQFVHGAQVTATLGVAGHETTLTAADTATGYTFTVAFATAGRQNLRLSVTPPSATPIAASFGAWVFPAAPASPPAKSAKPGKPAKHSAPKHEVHEAPHEVSAPHPTHERVEHRPAHAPAVTVIRPPASAPAEPIKPRALGPAHDTLRAP